MTVWQRSDVDLGQLWRGPFAMPFEVVYIADSPTVTLRMLDAAGKPTRQTFTAVISSPLFAEWRRLDPKEPR